MTFTLEEWLEKENMTIYRLEKELGYKHGYIYQIKAGKKPVTRRMAEKIYEFTKGEVILQ